MSAIYTKYYGQFLKLLSVALFDTLSWAFERYYLFEGTTFGAPAAYDILDHLAPFEDIGTKERRGRFKSLLKRG